VTKGKGSLKDNVDDDPGLYLKKVSTGIKKLKINKEGCHEKNNHEDTRERGSFNTGVGGGRWDVTIDLLSGKHQRKLPQLTQTVAVKICKTQTSPRRRFYTLKTDESREEHESMAKEEK